MVLTARDPIHTGQGSKTTSLSGPFLLFIFGHSLLAEPVTQKLRA